MSTKEKIVFAWSGGKDSALALHEVLRSERYEVVSLLTTVADTYRRVSHHGVREELLDLQAEALGLPLEKVYLPLSSGMPCTNQVWEDLMAGALTKFWKQGIKTVAHGDIFLQDLREYRERNLARLGMKGLFPIWQRDVRELVRTFIERGFRAYLCCVDGQSLEGSFAGRSIDRQFLEDLPPDVCPCGENGEYHSFVSDGPIFQHSVDVQRGEVVCRDNRYYVDLLPAVIGASDADRGRIRESAIPPI